MSRDPRVDAYIERQQPFAQPILRHLRDAVHAVCPDAEEAIKWGMPMFLRGGRILCNMAGFKAHAAFGFWRAGKPEAPAPGGEAMGQFGRLTSVADLPDAATLAGMIKAAMDRSEEAAPTPRRPPRPVPATPDDLAAALAADPLAQTAWNAFPPSHRRDYVDWLEEAKRPETRARRCTQAAAQIAEGKSRNWRYQRG